MGGGGVEIQLFLKTSRSGYHCTACSMFLPLRVGYTVCRLPSNYNVKPSTTDSIVYGVQLCL